MELLQAAPKILNPDPYVAPADGQRTFLAARDGEIGSKGMGCGVRDQPVRVLFGVPEIADPKEYPGSPGQSESKRCRMVLTFGILDGLACAFSGLGRVALQP
jgi:hypothetical protein